MDTRIAAAWAPLLPALDAPLVDYLASLATDDAAYTRWHTATDLHECIGDLLESYEAVENETEGKNVCEQLINKLQEMGICQGGDDRKTKGKVNVTATAAQPADNAHSSAPPPVAAAAVHATPSPSPVPAKPASASRSIPPAATPATPSIDPQPGYRCMARWRDGLFYPALILSVRRIPLLRIRVRFIQYGDEEDLTSNNIKDVRQATKEEEQKEQEESEEESDSDDDSHDEDEDDEDGTGSSKLLLKQPVMIDALPKSRAAQRVERASDDPQTSTSELTSKQLKQSKKRAMKLQRAEAVAIANRTWNPKQHRQLLQQEALPIYLEASKEVREKKLGVGKSMDIALEDLCLLAPDNTELLVNTELRLVHGRKYGLVGRNGIGKSTLLRALATYSIPQFPRHIKVVHVEQESVAENAPVLEVVINSDLERTALLKEEQELQAKLKEIENATAAAAAESSPSSSSSPSPPPSTAAISDRLTQVYERLTEMDAHSAEARAATILSGLGFTKEMQLMPMKAHSGGWRSRCALASSLFVAPDLLLLDEPTNHLDFPAVLWLQSYLQSYPKTVLVVSHDRTFLDAVLAERGDIIHFTNKRRLETFRGDYTSFVRVRAEKYKADKRAYESQQLQRQHLQQYITTFYTEKRSAAQARKVGQAMSKQKILDKMERDGLLEDPDEESTDKFSLHFPQPCPLRVPMVAEVRNLYFKYPRRRYEDILDDEAAMMKQAATSAVSAAAAAAGSHASSSAPAPLPPLPVDPDAPYLLEDINVRIELSSRIGILGANGCGKSTLIKLLLGDLQPIEGIINFNPNVQVGYFTQHHVDQLELGISATQWLREKFPGTTEVDARRYLGRFGLIGDLTMMQIGNLSGGQRSRLALSAICKLEPHVLILDEPTNHLDFETIDVLIAAIKEFKGAVVAISHDQYFLSQTVKEFWSISNKRLKMYESLDACKKATYKQALANA